MNSLDDEERLIQQLAEYILVRWEMEKSNDAALYAGAHGDEVAARELIKSFLGYCNDLKISPSGGLEVTSCFYAFKKVLERVLAVDMNDPSNRKGDLPRALGLASRRGAESMIEDRVIFFAFEYAQRDLGIPNRSHEECAYFVERAGEETGKFTRTPESIKKTYQRMLTEIRGS